MTSRFDGVGKRTNDVLLVEIERLDVGEVLGESLAGDGEGAMWTISP